MRGRRGGASDRGVTVVIFAVTITSLLAVGSLVLGGSIGYTAVRNVQTAVDAAAMAGASTLRDVKQGVSSAGEVLVDVRSVAEDNGATPGTVECDVIGAAYAISHAETDVLGPCTAANVNDTRAAGVRVRAGDTRDVPFGSFVDAETITGEAVAAATMQPIREGTAPFMVCSSPDAVGHPAQVLLGSGADPSGYSVNTSAIGLSYVIHGNEMKNGGRDCGNDSSSWRGLVEFGRSFPVPGTWEIKTGNANGRVPRQLSGDAVCDIESDAIADLTVGCRIALPMCPNGNGRTGVNFRYYCVKLGSFRVSWMAGESTGTPPCHPNPQGNSTICATFLGGATAVGGQGTATVPDVNALLAVKLVQ